MTQWFHGNEWSIGFEDAESTDRDGPYWLEWRAVECCGYDAHDPTKRYYGMLADDCRDPERAPTYAHGSIKWDGCINMAFDEQNDCMLHFCGTKDAKRTMNELFDMLHSVSMQLMPPYRRECASDGDADAALLERAARGDDRPVSY